MAAFMLPCLFFLIYQASAQSGQRNLEPEDYGRWGTLRANRLSHGGLWAAFEMQYKEADTLFISKTDGAKILAFPAALYCDFLGDGLAAVYNRGNKLDIVRLPNGMVETIEDVTKWTVLDNKYLLYLVSTRDTVTQLIVRDRYNTEIFRQDSLSEYSYCPASGTLAMVTKAHKGNAIVVLQLRGGQPQIIHRGPEKYSSLAWQENGKSLAALVTGAGQPELMFYELERGFKSFYDAEDYDCVLQSEIKKEYGAKLRISPDGQRVFFTVADPPLPTMENSVQVWGTLDKRLRIAEGSDRVLTTMVWWPREKKKLQLTSADASNLVLDGPMSFALTYDPYQYHPLPTMEGPSDIYICNIITGEQKLLTERQNTTVNTIYASPVGNYFIFSRDGDLWCYDAIKEIKVNLTSGLGSADRPKDLGYGIEEDFFQVVGWRDDGNTVLISNRKALFDVKLDGSGIQKRAACPEGSLRLIPHIQPQHTIASFNAPNFKGIYPYEVPLLIEASVDGKQQYYLWERRSGLKLVLNPGKLVSHIMLTKDQDVLLYSGEDFNYPPALMVKRRESAPKRIYQSNSHHWDYHWGKSTLVKYTNDKGVALQGALYYPAIYDESRNYPMVVHVYQRQSGEVHRYVNPSCFNYTGFNIANLTAQGYFVFLPDIEYTLGEPGVSAVDCVTSGVKAVLAFYPVNPDKIGLIGHSFGGFETDYILTRTHIFSAAVSGSAINDFHSSYLYVNPQMLLANFFKYEFGQFRMKRSLFDDKGGYYDNSVAFHADKINTPLLMWAGQEDKQVQYFQSMELYLALRRLGKEGYLLLYPTEGHIIETPEMQLDLTLKVEGWLNYHLSESCRPEWAK